MRKLLSAISSVVRFFKNLFWTKPTEVVKEKPKGIPAQEMNLQSMYVVISYHGQKINLRTSELGAFHKLSRENKRAMARKFAAMEKRGDVIFQEINGQLLAIKNKDYEAKANLRK